MPLRKATQNPCKEESKKGTLEIQQAIQLSAEARIELSIHELYRPYKRRYRRGGSEFRELLPLALRSITTVNDLQGLQQLILDLSALSSQDEAKPFLLSLLEILFTRNCLKKAFRGNFMRCGWQLSQQFVKRFPYSLQFPQTAR